jgi:hypothetical protein
MASWRATTSLDDFAFLVAGAGQPFAVVADLDLHVLAEQAGEQSADATRTVLRYLRSCPCMAASLSLAAGVAFHVPYCVLRVVEAAVTLRQVRQIGGAVGVRSDLP